MPPFADSSDDKAAEPGDTDMSGDDVTSHGKTLHAKQDQDKIRDPAKSQSNGFPQQALQKAVRSRNHAIEDSDDD